MMKYIPKKNKKIIQLICHFVKVSSFWQLIKECAPKKTLNPAQLQGVISLVNQE